MTTQTKTLALVFKPWRDKEICETCNDFHEGLELLCNGEFIPDLTDPHGPLIYNWEHIFRQLLKHLKVQAQVTKCRVYEGAGTHTLRISYMDRSLRRTVKWYDGDMPGDKGIKFLRRALELVGFESTIEVKEIVST